MVAANTEVASGKAAVGRWSVQILGHGDLSKKLAVSAHNFSKSAREKIEQAGGSITWLRGEPEPRKPKRRPRAAIPQAEPEPPETEDEAVENPQSDEPEATEEPESSSEADEDSEE